MPHVPDVLLRWLPVMCFCQYAWWGITGGNKVETILWCIATLVAIVAVELRRFRLAYEADMEPDPDPAQSTDRSTDVPG